MPTLTRRDFLKITSQALLALSGVLGIGAIWRFLSHPTEPPPRTEFDLGPASNYPLGSTTLVAEVPAVVFHNDTGFSALSLICPHLGCTMEQSASGFACPCHGSTFAEDGTPITGPAETTLPSLRIEQNGEGYIILYTQ